VKSNYEGYHGNLFPVLPELKRTPDRDQWVRFVRYEAKESIRDRPN